MPDKAEFAITDRATLDCAIAGMSIAVTHCCSGGVRIVPGDPFCSPSHFPSKVIATGHLIHVLRFAPMICVLVPMIRYRHFKKPLAVNVPI